MYCAKCGVKLADSEKNCPLCGTRAYHPDIERKEGEPPYPKNKHPKSDPKSLGLPIFATVCILLPIIIVLACDLRYNAAITWSGYVVGALLLFYVTLILPLWFKDPNPVIFVPCSFAAAGLYVAYINFAADGDWFLSFALPVIGALALIITAVCTLVRYLSHGKLFIFGGAFVAFGALMPLIEFLLNLTFPALSFIGWFIYPSAAFVLIGGFLIFLGICRPARESMERLFFI